MPGKRLQFVRRLVLFTLPDFMDQICKIRDLYVQGPAIKFYILNLANLTDSGV